MSLRIQLNDGNAPAMADVGWGGVLACRQPDLPIRALNHLLSVRLQPFLPVGIGGIAAFADIEK